MVKIKSIKLNPKWFQDLKAKWRPLSETEQIKRKLGSMAAEESSAGQAGAGSESSHQTGDKRRNPFERYGNTWERYEDHGGQFGEAKRRVFGGNAGPEGRRIGYFSIHRPYMQWLTIAGALTVVFWNFMDDLYQGWKYETRLNKEMAIYRARLDEEDRRFWRRFADHQRKQRTDKPLEPPPTTDNNTPQ